MNMFTLQTLAAKAEQSGEDLGGFMSPERLEIAGQVVLIGMGMVFAVLALLSWLATRRLRDVPGPLQNAAEMAVEKLQGFYGGILGPANARRYFPMMATFFIWPKISVNCMRMNSTSFSSARRMMSSLEYLFMVRLLYCDR